MAKLVLLSSVLLLLMTMPLLLLLPAATGSPATDADEKECADQLQNLAACIPYVSGSAKKPTPECCADAEKVRANQPKCLCVLIKESTDPALGLPVNTTLALHMPAACNSDAKVSDCPSILKLPPDSPDAKIFKDADAVATASPSSASSSPSSSSAGTGSAGTEAAGAEVSSRGERLEWLMGGCLEALLMVSSVPLLV